MIPILSETERKSRPPYLIDIFQNQPAQMTALPPPDYCFLCQGVHVPDETGFETLSEIEIELSELRERLTRGGLAPEAVEKAVEAYEAGDIFALNFSTVLDGALVCSVPEELLRKVFPIPDPLPAPEDLLNGCIYLEYEINRHRYGKKSLTLRWPGDKNQDGEEVPGPAPTDPYTDMICEAHPDKPWPHDDCPGPGMPPSDAPNPRKDANRDEDPWPDGEPPKRG